MSCGGQPKDQPDVNFRPDCLHFRGHVRPGMLDVDLLRHLDHRSVPPFSSAGNRADGKQEYRDKQQPDQAAVCTVIFYGSPHDRPFETAFDDAVP